MVQPLPYVDIQFGKIVTSEEFLYTPDDSDLGYFIECDLTYPDKINEKTKNFPFGPENMVSDQGKLGDTTNEKKPNTYTQNKKLIFVWTDEKIFLIHYRVLKRL